MLVVHSDLMRFWDSYTELKDTCIFCNVFRVFFSVKIKQLKNYMQYPSIYAWIYFMFIHRSTFPHLPNPQEHTHCWNAELKVKIYWFHHLFFQGKKSYFKLIRLVKQNCLVSLNYKLFYLESLFSNTCYFQNLSNLNYYPSKSSRNPLFIHKLGSFINNIKHLV